MNKSFLKALIVGALLIFGATDLAAKSKTVEGGYYTSRDPEFYLTPKEIFFVRPGLVMTITDVVIPSDRKPEVTFTLADPAGLPLDREGLDTPGPVSTSFILAYIPAFEEAYVAYTTRVQTSPNGNSVTQASTDSGGTYTTIGEGTYKYKFGTELPADYDQDATHTLGAYASRNLSDFELGTYYANVLDHFVPSGLGEPVPRDIVTTETCNGRCHDPIAVHGGSRREVGLCVLCHNPSQGIDPDTGNSVDMPVLIHKIHMGENLTQDYTIIGFRQSVHNYNHVVYPAEINECDACHTGGIPTDSLPMVATPSSALVCDASGVGEVSLEWQYTDNVQIRVRSASNPDGTLFAMGGPNGSVATGKWVADGTVFDLYDLRTGLLVQSVPVNATVLGCSGNAPGSPRGEPGTQHSKWKDNPSRTACGACHDYIDWETGEGHSDYNLAMADDNTCGNCHVPDSGQEFDRSVTGAHLPLYKSSQFQGLLFEFVDITNIGPGQAPTVRFKLSSKTGTLDPNTINRLRLNISGPNTDFYYYNQETVSGAVLNDGVWSYTFANALPADAEGSYTVGVEGRATSVVNGSNQNEPLQATTMAFAVTGDVEPRRTVVEDYNCESCHLNLVLHGNNRTNANYCVTCHMPLATDAAQVPPGDPEQTIHFKYMIHSIHRGAELEKGFVVRGFNQSIHDYSDVEYPGDLRDCDKCHRNNSQQLSGLPAGLLPTLTPQGLWSPTQPQAAACLSCHDSDEAANHAYTNSTSFGESCATCHGEGKVASVDKVHAH